MPAKSNTAGIAAQIALSAFPGSNNVDYQIMFANSDAEEELRGIFLDSEMDIAGDIQDHVLIRKGDEIIGGGMPVGAYGARKELMSHIAPEGNVYQAGTLSGNPVAMSAGIAQLRECLKPGFYESLAQKTSVFTSQLNTYSKSKGYLFKVFSIGSIFWFAFTEKEKISSAEEISTESMKYFRILHAELLERGIYLGPSGYEVGFISAAHSAEILKVSASKICEALDAVFVALPEGISKV